MTNGRRTAVSNGQFLKELRSRDQSGRLFGEIDLLHFIRSIGEECWATSVTSLALFGVEGFSIRPPHHVVVLRDDRASRAGHFVHSTLVLDPIDREQHRGIPSVSPTRAVISASSILDEEILEQTVARMLLTGLTSHDLLHRRVSALRTTGRYGLPKLVRVLERAEIVSGATSWLEQEFLRLIDVAGLPRPIAQVALTKRGDRVVRVDFHWPGTDTVVEVLGYQWHRSGAHLDIDARRANALVLAGYRCFQFTYLQIVNDPGDVITTLRQLFDERTGAAA